MAVKEPLTIREYRPEDLEALLPLYEQLGYPTRTDELRDRLAGLLSHEDYHLLVAECDGQLVAFIGYARMYFLSTTGLIIGFWPWRYQRIIGRRKGAGFKQRNGSAAEGSPHFL